MKKAALLRNPQKVNHYAIELQLTNKQTARFTYSNQRTARNHYDEIIVRGVVGGEAVKECVFREVYEAES
jgi:hypothetical protein